MRRDIGGHSDRDSGRAVDKQVRELRRQNRRFGPGLIVVRYEINGVVLEIFEHVRCRGSHSCLGISHRRRRIGIDTPEVALRVHQRITHIPFLAQPDQCSIGCLVTVRVVIAAGITDDLGALSVLASGAEVQVVHCNQDASLRRFQTIANVRQRT